MFHPLNGRNDFDDANSDGLLLQRANRTGLTLTPILASVIAERYQELDGDAVKLKEEFGLSDEQLAALFNSQRRQISFA